MKTACPAKINLTLEVLDRRDDGYHALRSVMVPLQLADELTFEASERFSFACDRADLESADNLVLRAVAACAPDARVSIALQKRIPTQAGLGGGSSDAASALLAAMGGALGTMPAIDWLATARRLGSDVPFFLAQSGALVEGTGERVTPLGALPAWHVLIVKPPSAVSTAAAYAELDRISRPSRPRSSSVSLDLLSALQRCDFERVQTLLSNDFHETIAATTPDVARTIDALTQAGAARPLLAGSGSAVFAIAQTGAEIANIESRLTLPSEFLRFRTAFRESGAWRG
jgi:4-diphosphocytidyl-2-C-methyl-D-erythritol kinase